MPGWCIDLQAFRFRARAWELGRHDGVSSHDGIGSNLSVRTRAGQVMRVDPRENEDVNECWIPDRDRYSYEALNGGDRLLQPMVKRDGVWEQVTWSVALETVVKRLRAVIGADGAGADRFGALLSPNATNEEMYLLQRLVRELGSPNIDHRLRQSDFRDEEHAPPSPWLGQSLAALSTADAVLLVGSHTRKDQPILAHRLRQSALEGTVVMFINPVAYEFNFPLADNVVAGADLVPALAAVAKAVLQRKNAAAPAGYERLFATVIVDEPARRIAAKLAGARQPALLLGDIAAMHPDYATLRALAGVIARALGVETGYLVPGANAAGAWLTGAVPHRAPGGEDAQRRGLNALAMLEQRLKAYLLFNIEPEYDCADPALALAALREAEFVVALNPCDSETMREYADVLLPIAAYTETAGSHVSLEGRWQSFNGAVKPVGEARPGCACAGQSVRSGRFRIHVGGRHP